MEPVGKLNSNQSQSGEEQGYLSSQEKLSVSLFSLCSVKLYSSVLTLYNSFCGSPHYLPLSRLNPASGCYQRMLMGKSYCALVRNSSKPGKMDSVIIMKKISGIKLSHIVKATELTADFPSRSRIHIVNSALM